MERLPHLELKNINKLNLDKKLVNIGEMLRNKRKFNQLLLPFTMNSDYYGILLKKEYISIQDKNKISHVMLYNENILDLIEKTSLSLSLS